jgi:hypothetical protein
VEINDTRLDHRETILDVDLENLSHAREFDHHSGFERKRAAG